MKKNIIIVGAGFGGLKLAQKLSTNKKFNIILIDKNNFHQFQPLFYEVATSNLEYSDICIPIRRLINKNVKIFFNEIQQIDEEKNEIIINNIKIQYDKLVISTGSSNNFFGNQKLKELSYPMKTIYETLKLKNKIIEEIEKLNNKNTFLNIIIVGAGPTGIELAGSISFIKNKIINKEYKNLNKTNINIYLIEGSDKILGTMSKSSQRNTYNYLKNLGVNILLNSKVINYDNNILYLEDRRTIETPILIWAAGIQGNLPDNLPKSLTIGPGNRIMVDENCLAIGTKNIYAIGDVSFMQTKQNPRGLPQTARVAIEQAIYLSKLFNNKINKKIKFIFSNPGSMAIISRYKAVAEIKKIKINGFIAWFIWKFLHLFLIPNIKNKILIFINWVDLFINNNTWFKINLKNLHYDKFTKR